MASVDASGFVNDAARLDNKIDIGYVYGQLG